MLGAVPMTFIHYLVGGIPEHMLGFVLGSKSIFFYMKFVGANVGPLEYLPGRQTCQATQSMPGWQERQDISISLYN